MSLYDLPKLTHQVRQFGNPALGDRLSSALAEPSESLVASEDASLERAIETGVETPSNPRPDMFAHRDYYRNQYDSASINKRTDLE